MTEQRSKTVASRMTIRERALVQLAAEHAELTLSRFVAEAAISRAEEVLGDANVAWVPLSSGDFEVHLTRPVGPDDKARVAKPRSMDLTIRNKFGQWVPRGNI